MKRSNRLVILVGVLLAVLAFVGMVILLNSPQKSGIGNGGPITPTTKVLIALRDIAIDDKVTPEMVKVTAVDPGAVDGTPLGDASLLRNRVALRPVPKGAQVNSEVFGCVGCKGVDIVGQLKSGEKAIAFQVDSVTGLDFLVKQGDLVDIVISQEVPVTQETADSVAARAENRSLPPRFESVPGLQNLISVKTVLQAKRVLYVSDTKIQPQSAQATPTPSAGAPAAQPAPIDRVVVVIAGTDADAELIKLAEKDSTAIGPLSVILRNPEDKAIEATKGITLRGLVDRYAVPIPAIVQAVGTAGK